jgi:hypothetical protein
MLSRIACPVVVCLLIAPGLAHAVSHAHNGNFCQKTAGEVVYTSEFGVKNASAASAIVVCPLQRDQSQEWNTMKRVRVVVYDRHPNLPVSCVVNVIDSKGVPFWETSTLSTAGSGGGPMILEWPLSLGITSLITATLVCTIPPVASGQTSHVASYLYIEE